MGGNRPFPKTVIEFLERQNELMPVTEVQLDYSGNHKYPTIKDFKLGERVGERPANDNQPAPANDNSKWARDMDDEIPF